MVDTRWAALAALMLAIAGCAGPSGGDGENPRAVLETDRGDITILLYGNLTPQTVQSFGNLTQEDFYDGMRFHRVIEGFMIQGGDPLSKDTEKKDRWGTGGPGYTILDEFACKDGTVSNDLTRYQSQAEPCDGHDGLQLKHDKAGMVSMANRGEPKTGGSQFFITVAPQPSLDGTHPVFGEVVDGMDVVRNISKVPTDSRDRPTEDVVVQDVSIEGQLPGVEVEKFDR